jgi:uncharacterized protein YllA (UPF0747 family)
MYRPWKNSRTPISETTMFHKKVQTPDEYMLDEIHKDVARLEVAQARMRDQLNSIEERLAMVLDHFDKLCGVYDAIIND